LWSHDPGEDGKKSMVRSAKSNTGGTGALVGAMLLAIATLVAWVTQPTSAAEPGPSAAAPSTVTGGGLTLRSVNVDFPDPGRTFPGDTNANAINNNCLACHSAGMVLTQPTTLSRTDWQAEVDKMRNTYKAPIAEKDVPAIVDYLASLNNMK
jgi:hypothetical protein